MNEPAANPIFVALLFILRCLVPLAILFGVSYLLRHFGLVKIDAPEPTDEEYADEDEEEFQDEEDAQDEDPNKKQKES
jgi:hypothetical protein